MNVSRTHTDKIVLCSQTTSCVNTHRVRAKCDCAGELIKHKRDSATCDVRTHIRNYNNENPYTPCYNHRIQFAQPQPTQPSAHSRTQPSRVMCRVCCVCCSVAAGRISNFEQRCVIAKRDENKSTSSAQTHNPTNIRTAASTPTMHNFCTYVRNYLFTELCVSSG